MSSLRLAAKNPACTGGLNTTRFYSICKRLRCKGGGVESSELHLKLRTELRTVNFADAHVEAWHEAPEDPNSNSNVSGGAFFSEGSFTLTRSRLTATWIVFKFRILSIALVSDMKF